MSLQIDGKRLNREIKHLHKIWNVQYVFYAIFT